MIRNLTIEHRVCRNNLGDSNDAFAASYVTVLTDALKLEYPEADITVNLHSDFSNSCQTLISGDNDPEDGDVLSEVRENVGVVANRVWDRM